MSSAFVEYVGYLVQGQTYNHTNKTRKPSCRWHTRATRCNV